MPAFRQGQKEDINNLPFIRALRERGYNWKNLPQILGTSPTNYLKLFEQPDKMTGKQYIILSQLLLIPLPEVINTLFRTPPQSPHYLKGDYSTNSHVEKIKAELATKLSKDQSEPK